MVNQIIHVVSVAMANYSIKDLEKISGIKAHTIRIWEKRYQLVNPRRTCTNIRLYSDEDIKRILNVSILNRHGFKISQIANLDSRELNEKVLHISQHSPHEEDRVEQLVICMIEMDENKFEKLLSSSIMKKGFEQTITSTIYPFLEKVGILWQTGTINPAQEHFVSNLIRQKLIVAIDGLIPPENIKAKDFTLFLPEGEFHELGLLYYFYLIKKKGHKVIYLGNSVPLKDLVEVSAYHEPDLLVTFFVAAQVQDEHESYVFKLSEHFRKQKICISGLQTYNFDFQLPNNVEVYKDPIRFNEMLDSL